MIPCIQIRIHRKICIRPPRNLNPPYIFQNTLYIISPFCVQIIHKCSNGQMDTLENHTAPRAAFSPLIWDCRWTTIRKFSHKLGHSQTQLSCKTVPVTSISLQYGRPARTHNKWKRFSSAFERPCVLSKDCFRRDHPKHRHLLELPVDQLYWSSSQNVLAIT